MDKILLIVESPAKIRTIKKFLQEDFNIQPCLGHLVDLPVKELGVDIGEGFKPHYVVIPARKKVLNQLKKEAKNAKKIYIATDPDREGEAIAWHLSNQLKKSCPEIFRVSFNEITRTSVLNAIKKPGEINKNKVNAQQARRILDRLVGYRLSPLLWVKVSKGLSAGRVQSVAVRLICEREKEIKEFKPQEYWIIEGEFQKEGYVSFKAKLNKCDDGKIEIAAEKEAQKITDELKPETFLVSDVNRKETRKFASPAFITSTMQQDAVGRLGFSAKFTMSLAQQLYEGIELGEQGSVGLITYMRTDSVRVAQEALDEVRGFIRDKFGEDYVPKKNIQYKSKGHQQGAHEAIRPTAVGREPEKIKSFLSPQQFKLYELIWKRFVASQMNPAVIKILAVKIKAKNYIFHASSSSVKFSGYQKIYGNNSKGEEKTLLPPLAPGEKLELLKLDSTQHFTLSPPRYNEASLIRILEEKGIGRPSTYAFIVDTIQQRDYVRKDSGRFYPTELGAIINDLLVKNFPKVLNVEFTAGLEDKLDKIEEGQNDWQKVLKDFYEPFKNKLDKASKKVKKINHIEVTDECCEKCGRKMVIKMGRYGKFLACSGYPACRNSSSLTMGVACPEPNCTGEIIERRGKKGTIFYGCSEFPKCKFSMRQKPVKKVCPKCGAGFLVEKMLRNTFIHKCPNENCSYTEEVKEQSGK